MATHRSHPSHGEGRIWPETNCYLDVWIEILHCLGLDPVPSFACLLAADHDGAQWDFVKQPTEDLRRLYGLQVAEESIWRSVLDTVCDGLARGMLHTVEVDSWWLPDTAGTAYRTDHVKTTVVVTACDRERRTMTYLHNAGLFALSGEDFDELWRATDAGLPPYVERISLRPGQAEPGAADALVVQYLRRRPAGNPVLRLGTAVHEAQGWLPQAGIGVFHRWAFATLRQCGATAELLGDLAGRLEASHPGAGAAAEPFAEAAAAAKSVQFKLARAAAGRTVDVAPGLAVLATSWEKAMERVTEAVG